MVKLNSLQRWDSLYQEGKQLSTWPWSDLVSFVCRYVVCAKKKKIRVLELGCGAGANIPFFLSLKAHYYGIDGSDYIIKRLKKRYPELKNQLIKSDFTQNIPFKQKFDLVVDRASLTHNTTDAIENCLRMVYSKLKPGGTFIGIDWFSTRHDDYKKGKPVGKDIYSKTKFLSGQFTEIELVHFSNKQHLLDLFKDFEIKNLEHKIIKTEVPIKDKHIFSSWNLLAIKK